MDIKQPLSNRDLAEALYEKGVDILSEEALENLLPHSARLSITGRDQVTDAFAADIVALARVSGLSAHVVARPFEPAPPEEGASDLPPAVPAEPAKGRKRADA